MPELPEVECVRRSLEPALIGQTLREVLRHRPDVVRGDASAHGLLRGQRIERLARHGKQLALVGRGPGGTAGCAVVHLGMSGQLRWSPVSSDPAPRHTHVVWRFDQGELRFTDPRRFGGVWVFPSLEAAYTARWASLGPDALLVTQARLHRALSRTTRMLKPALLDQAVVAGLGNIYVDELLFGAKLPPTLPAHAVTPAQAGSLARRMKTLLGRAIRAGGSTLRDYVDGSGSAGGYQLAHRVYGRAGQQCLRRGCGVDLACCTLAGRTTVYCPACQG
jgi:formamidopyrimidine-DNA glycosylase